MTPPHARCWYTHCGMRSPTIGCNHPRVHIMHRVPQPNFSSDTPAKYTGNPDKRAHHAHWDVAFILLSNTQGCENYVDETKPTTDFQDADTEHCGKPFPVVHLSAAQKRDMTHGTHDMSGASDKPCHADTHDAHTGVPTPDAHHNMALHI